VGERRMTLRTAAQNVVDVWNRYGTAQSLRGWMEILEAEVNKCDRCGKVTRNGDVHTCTPRRLTDEVRMLQEQNTELDRKLSELSERRLTDEVIADLWARNGTYHHHFARAIERWLKGQE
jgi:recombinational DNA repair protein RecR